MNLLANPIVVRTLLGFVLALVLFVVGIWLIRKLRPKSAEPEVERPVASTEAQGFAVEAYHGVIKRLKDQEQELQRLRHEASTRATLSESLSAAVLSNLTSGVIVFNPGCLVQQANKAGREILGYASPTGLHARDLFKGVINLRRETGESYSTSEPLLEALELCITQNIPYRRMELEYITPGDQVRVLGITLSPVRGLSGSPLGAACLVSDLTQITNLSRQVRLRENLSALGEMSAGIAHEFKNSLATISGYAQMLATSTDDSSRDFGQRIANETATLNRIVSDFLSFARPQELRASFIDFQSLIDECARETKIHLECETLPSGFGLFGDPIALRQVFSNLFRNSAESSAAEPSAVGRIPSLPDVTVRISVKSHDETAEVVINDNGPGIPRENLEKIFIPFFTTKPHGTGLGLALVHRIVTEHGGTVSVDTGQSGTTFTLSLPLGKPSSKLTQSR
jgi:signal transduction histidine kinase